MTVTLVLLAVAALVAVILVPAVRVNRKPIDATELGQLLAAVGASLPLSGGALSEFLKRLRAFGEQDDGRPVHMLNLMRYFTEVRAGGGIPVDYAGSPKEANAYYERNVVPLALEKGAYPIFLGNVTEANVVAPSNDTDNWNRVIVMRYPNRRAFFELLADPRYADFVPYKFGSLDLGLVPMHAQSGAKAAKIAALFSPALSKLRGKQRGL